MEEITNVGRDVTRIEVSEVVGITIANMGYDQTVEQIIDWADKGERRYVCVCNVHSLTSSLWTPDLKWALECADVNTADGMPLVWMQRAVGYKNASRVYGPTLMLELLKRCNEKGLRVAFYGGHKGRVYSLVKNLAKRFTNLKIVKFISPPFRPLTEEEDYKFTRELQQAKPDIVFVGIGCPKQEVWMQKHSHKIDAVMVGVGAAFDFHAGAVKQAPAILQKMGLEWAYRLYCEPRRLFRRYISTNPLFVGLAVSQIVGKYVFRRKYIQSKLFLGGVN